MDKKILLVFWFREQMVAQVGIKGMLGLFQEKEKKKKNQGFFGGSVVKNPPANAGDTCSIPGLGGSHKPRSN